MNERIFVIEDDENIQEIVKLSLESNGYQVVLYGNAIDAKVGAVGSITSSGGTKTFLAVGEKNCLQVGIRDSAESTYIAFAPVAENKNAGACATFLASDLVKQLLDGTKPAGDDPELNFCQGIKNGGMSCMVISPSRIY